MVLRRADVVIIGSGLAGLMTAEILSAKKNVIIITKTKLGHGNSSMAQGGIAAAVDSEDDWREHFFDTVVAGGYHNDVEMTKKLVQLGPYMIKKLVELGVQFDRDKHGNYALGMEGAHRKRRILHAGGDATGKELIEVLMKRIREHVTIFEDEMALDLLIDKEGSCKGVVTQTNAGERHFYIAQHTILATGGAGQLYEVTSNCQEVTGDGMAMAFRAGAELVDMEFVQFHPTMLVKDGKAYGLVSEAVRGEGAKLVTDDGVYIMEGVHELKDLAPRDIVSREIYSSLKANKELFLDIRPIPDFTRRFPTISAICKQAGVCLEEGKIPVAPGAHFIMGGIAVNGKGETSVEGLFAVGETAKTGVHGANRLASNSLLEAIVFANELANYIMQKPNVIPSYVPVDSVTPFEGNLPSLDEIKKKMTNYVGIIREHDGLTIAKEWFEKFLPIIYENRDFWLSNEQKTKVNLLTIGYCVADAALTRMESRGGHYRLDYPINDDRWLGREIIYANKVDFPLIKKYDNMTMSI